MPETTSVLDTFNRANAPTTLGANWSLLTDFGIGGTNLGVISNQAYRGSGVGYVVMYWNPSVYGPNCEVYMDIPTWGNSDNFALYARIRSAGGSYNGYNLSISPGSPDTWIINRINSGTE